MSTLRPNPTRRRASLWALALSALGFGAWWVLSILLHVAFFGGIYIAAPEPDPSAEDEFTMRISPDRVREVVAEIRHEESQAFREKLEELLKIKAELDQLNADKIAQYNEIIREEIPRARERLPDAFTRVTAAQKEALAAQETAQKALAAFAAHEKASASANPEDAKAAEALAEAALQNALAAQEHAGQAQHQAKLAQEEVATQLRLAEVPADASDSHQSAESAHLAALDAQNGATATQKATTEIIKQLANARRSLANAEQAMDREQAALQKVKDRAEAAQAVVASRQEAVDASRQKIADAQATADETAKAAKTATEEKKRLASLAKDAATKLKRERDALKKAEQRLRSAQAAAKRHDGAVAKHQRKTDEALAVVQKRQEVVNETTATVVDRAEDRQESSTAVQQTSLALQEAVNSAVTRALADAKAGSAAPAGARPSVLPTPTLDPAMTLADLFEQAQAAETAVAETFKNVRAAELAAIRKIPLSEALAMTKVATPERPALNTAILEQDIASVAAVREQEKAIGAASDQMASMVALAQRMREVAAFSGANLSVAEIQAQSDRNARMELLAMEDAGAKAKDLSGEMAAAHGEGTGFGSGLPGEDPTVPSTGSGGAGDYGQGAPDTVPGIVGISVKNYKPLHGRTVRHGMVTIEAGRNPEWLYVDTWHLIGPWPNPGRKNLDTKFPPETVVNLDAIYQGGRKDGIPRPIQWEFFQVPPKVTGKDRTPTVPMVRPPGLGDYEIYYAYTELWFDEPADLWVAIGSDDQSKVWLNDLLIWKSGDAHKTWRANEGLRKVHFRKGINRVLYRLENGQNSGGFSFLVCLAENPAASP